MAATLTLLQIVQEVSRRHGITVPTAVVASQDETIQQLYGLANETVEELNSRYRWVQLVTPYEFNHNDDSDYGALTISGPAADVVDWKAYEQRTLWDVTAGLELIGPVPEKDWQAMVNLNISAGRYSFRFYGAKLFIFPAPTVPADVDFRLEYYSSAPVLDTDGTTVKDRYAADTDTCRLPTQLVIDGLRWRYKKEKGLPYAEDKDTYEMACAQSASDSGQEGEVQLDQDSFTDTRGPMIVIPPGSWPV